MRKDEITQIASALHRSGTVGPAEERGRPQNIIGKLEGEVRPAGASLIGPGLCPSHESSSGSVTITSTMFVTVLSSS